MAFKKTGMGRVKVSPVGMPDLSGYKSFAKSVEIASENLGSIGTSLRKREFTEAMLQAEIDGKTAGVTYDKDGNLVPLKNLNYGVADSFFGDNDARNLQLQYEKNAIASYALAISNDSNKYANIALQNNPNNPNGVRASLDGYLEGIIGEMPDSVRVAVMPEITANFTQAENQARAGQIQKVRSDQEAIALESIDINSKKLATLMATGDPMTNNSQMFSELKDNISASQEVLRGLGYTDVDLQNQNKTIKTNIAVKSAMQAVDDLMLVGDLSQAWTLMSDMKIEFMDDADIDSDAVSAAMDQVWNFRTKQDLIQEQESNEVSQNAYNQGLINIINPEVENPSVMDILNDEVMNEGHKYSLISVLSNTEAGIAAQKERAREAEQKVFNEKYDTQMININNPSAENMGMFYKSAGTIKSMYVNGQIDADKFDKFLQKFNKFNSNVLEAAQKDAAAVIKADLGLKMGEVGGYLTPPSVFKDVIEQYVNEGVITREGPFTFDDAENLLNSYERNFKLEFGNREKLAEAVGKAKSNQTLNSSEIKLIEDNLAPKFVNVDGVNVKLNLFSDDPITQQASLAAAVSYSSQYPNLIHPQIKQVIKDLPFITDEVAFDASKQFLGSLASSMRISGQYGVFLQNLERNGFDQAILWNAENYGFQDFRRIMESGSDNAQRKISALLPKDADRDEYFLQQFDRIKGEGEGALVYSILYNTSLLGTRSSAEMSANEQAIIDNFETKYGVSIEDVVLRDPRIVSLIQENAFSYIGSGRYDADEKGFRGAIIKSMSDLIGVVGIEEVGEDYEFTLRPIVHEANKTAPEAITIYKDDIIDDVIYRISQVPSLQTDAFTEASKDRSNYFFRINDATFDRPSYDVYLKVDGENIPVFQDYRFDFAHSYQNESYMKALDSFQNDTTKQLWRVLPFIDGALLNQTFRKYKSTDRRTFSDKNAIEEFVTFYNNNIAYNLGGLDYIDPDELGDRDINKFIQAWMTLGFR